MEATPTPNAGADSVASLLAAALSPSQAKAIAAQVGGPATLENFEWLRGLLVRLRSAQDEVQHEKAARQNDQVNHEQRLHDLEEQFMAVSQTNTQLKVKVESLESQNQSLTAELKQAQAKSTEAASKFSECATQLQLQRQKLAFAKQENEVLASAAERKQGTIDELRSELAEVRQAAAEKAQAASGQVADLFAQRSDASLRSKIEFLEKERTLLRDSAALLEERLTRQTEQLFKTKESLTARNKELEALIPHRESELESLRTRLQNREKELADTSSALEASRRTMRQMQEDHSSQVATLSEKAAKYEELAANLEVSLSEAEQLVQSLRTRHEKFREATSARQAEDRELLQTFERDAAAKNKTIEELRTAVRQLENDAAVTGQARLGGSGRGTSVEPSAMIQKLVQHTGSGTLSDWYERIVSAEKQRDQSVKEKEHLNQLMNNILVAIEQQGPMLKAQSDDYKRALEAQQDLADQIRDLDAENERLRDELADLADVQVSNRAMKKTIATLEESNRNLLWASEGGGRVKPNSDSMQQALTAAATSRSSTVELADAVQRHLPQYTNLAELSVKHTQLVQAFNELSQRANESGKEAQQNAEIEREVGQFKQQLKTLVAARERSQQKIQSLVQQRDALQMALSNKDRSYLLQHARASANASGPPSSSIGHSQDSSPAPSTSLVSASAEEVDRLRRNLQSTQDTFEQYKKQRIAADDAQAKLLSDARAEANAKARDLSVAERNVEIFRDRVSELKVALDAARTELRDEKSKHARTFDGLLAQQTAANQVTHAREQDRLELANLRADHAKIKSQLALRAAECDRLQGRVDELDQQLRSQSSLLDKVQSIESAVAAQKEAELSRISTERDEARRSAAELTSTVESLRADIQRLEAAARGEAAERASALVRHESALREAQQQAQTASSDLAAAREKYAALKAQHDALQAHLGGLKRRQSIRANAAASVHGHSGTSGGVGSSSAEDTEMSVAVLDLPDSQVAEEAASTIARQATDIRELQVLLKSTEDAFEAQQATLDAQETNIKTLEARATDLQNKLAEQTEAAAQARTEASNLAEELAAAKASGDARVAELQTQLAAIEKRVASIDEREAALQDSINEHKAEAAAAQERYRHEHKEHEQDMEALEKAREEVTRLTNELSNVKVHSAEETSQARALAAAKTAEAQDIAKRLAARDKEVAAIEAQNALLHRQMAALDVQIERARSAALDVTRESRPEDFGILDGGEATGAGQATNDDENSAAAEISRLKAMLKFHKDKHSVVQTKLDLQTKHVDELERRVRSLESSLREAEATAAEAASASTVSTSEEHEKLLQDVERLHILHESNQQLRFQLKKAQTDNAALSAKLADAEKRLREDRSAEQLKKLATKLADTERRLRDAEADRKLFQEQAQNVVAQIDMIDPAEHKRLQALLQTAKQEAAAAAAAVAAAKKEAAQATAQLEAERKRAAVKLAEALEEKKADATTAAKLREHLKKKNKEVHELQKKAALVQQTEQALRRQLAAAVAKGKKNRIRDADATC
eukprot:INCI16630.2.p1 GENE.INCI16630.2~~INCI16630.2.p1  ORF type:complete len:1530 (+),score=449.87 INCI16630.2:240-4829(+)